MTFRTHLALAATVLALGACADAGAPSDLPTTATAATGSAGTAGGAAPLARTRAGDRLATVEWEGRTPVLYVQSADGTNRVRVHFDHVSDHVTDNYSPRQLLLTDASIIAIRRAKWSPDGRYLAVEVSPAFDVTTVVLVSADGRAMRVVAPNSQYMNSDIEWSPDGRRIAYAMATNPYARRADIFVTDLGADRVTRVTTGNLLTWYDTYRFDPTGQRLYFTERLGWADDGVNGSTRMAYADLGTGAIVEGATITGDPQALARDGSWGLFVRYTGENFATTELVRVPLAGGRETVLTSGGLWSATLVEGEQEAVVKAPNDATGEMTYHVFGTATPNDDRGALPTVGATDWEALWRAR